MKTPVGVRDLASGAGLRLFAVTALGLLAVASAGGAAVQGGDFESPAEGTLYVKCVSGSAGASSQFGIGTSPANFKALLSDIPARCPSAEVRIGHVSEGERIVFGLRTSWGERTEWAFSNRSDRSSMVAFRDGNNLLRKGGTVVQAITPNVWILHLDDAASYLIDDDNDDILIQIRFEVDGAGRGGPASN